MKKLAIDVGGTNIKLGIVEEGRITNFTSIPSHLNNPSKMREALEKSILEIKKSHEVGEAYLSTACLVTEQGKILKCNENSFRYENFDWKEFLSNYNIELKRALNDSESFARYQILKGNANFISIVIGTGVGISITENGKVVDGKDFKSGQVGSIKLNGRLTIDNQFSATKLKEKISNAINDSKWSYSNLEKICLKNDLAYKIINTWSDELSKLLIFVSTLFGINKVFIGGGVSFAGSFLKNNLLKYLKINLPNNLENRIEIILSEDRNNSNLLGVI